MTRRQGIPGELSGIIDKALEKFPEDRHKTWDEFIREIEDAQIAMRTKYDYDYDMLRGFCDLTLKQYIADQHKDILRGDCDLTMEQRHTDAFELPGGPYRDDAC